MSWNATYGLCHRLAHAGFELMEALMHFIAVDNARALVTMGELAKYREVRYPHVCVSSKETRRRGAEDAEHVKDPGGKLETFH